MAGWSKNTQVELRALLRSHGQSIDGSKAALVQRLTAFLSDSMRSSLSVAAGDVVGGEEPSASKAAEQEAAELQVERIEAELEAARLQVARIEAAKIEAHAALHPHRVRHNEQSCALLQLAAHDDLRPTFMRSDVWGVLGLWRLRGVCRAFRGWAQVELVSLPRVVAVGGLLDKTTETDDEDGEDDDVATSSVESLDLSTMRWSAAGCMPSLPDGRVFHSMSSGACGQVVVCGGDKYGQVVRWYDLQERLGRTAVQWLPGASAWSALPDLPGVRNRAASVGLPDGRTMLIGGRTEGQTLASVVVLAADGSGWSELPPLNGPRGTAAAALLPDGKVLVAGGRSDLFDNTALNTAELWDPATQKWTVLPPMAHERAHADACVLPSGRVAVIGGFGTDGAVRKDGEVYDPARREWEPLGAETAINSGLIDAVAVAGGLVQFGYKCRAELYDEGSGRWFSLPHAMMVQPRHCNGFVSVPAAALA
jgi:hypothetical protein